MCLSSARSDGGQKFGCVGIAVDPSSPASWIRERDQVDVPAVGRRRAPRRLERPGDRIIWRAPLAPSCVADGGLLAGSQRFDPIDATARTPWNEVPPPHQRS